RLDIGRQKMKQYADVFSRAEQEFGVPPGFITAFWAMETDFVAVLNHLDKGDQLRAEEFREAAVMRQRNQGVAGVEI
ncbi:lytic murein transglycosylase, partial [Rhizobium ruizarguesonis]